MFRGAGLERRKVQWGGAPDHTQTDNNAGAIFNRLSR